MFYCCYKMCIRDRSRPARTSLGEYIFFIEIDANAVSYTHLIESFTESGEKYYRYGGDFGDDPSNKDFCIDGLIMPDRTPSPGLYEYKKVIEPITTTAVDIQKGIINLLSRYDFANLDRFNLVYKVMEDDVILQTGFMAVPSIEALSLIHI